ncbi:PREDICTED: uncharacterized protein LOC109181303 [Ipomoea nil]|uniref:uncharacterized protein LOC109181303 n=1 Tax=Ipomoea nil TaxID=35883 RepID=UPI0009011D40|nr:PREDICTED: uncharacterized protein LOC109181303 [Ipomoea nil]
MPSQPITTSDTFQPQDALRRSTRLRRPNPRYSDYVINLTTAHPLPLTLEPSTVAQALKDALWKKAIDEEFDALHHNKTWRLVPRGVGVPISCKWVYCIKRKPDGSIVRYKARLIAKGFLHATGRDYFETYSLVMKSVTIRLVLSIALSNHWGLHQLDINNAFLHDTLHEEVYMKQPPAQFALKDLGTLHHFLGVEIIPTGDGVFLSQRQYITGILTQFKIDGAKNVSTPLAASKKLVSLQSSDTTTDATLFRRLLGLMRYLVITQPDVAFVVNKLSQFMHAPSDLHWQAAKCLLRYLKGTVCHGVFLRVGQPLSLRVYTDSDWGGCTTAGCSTTAYLVYLGNNLISWKSTRQKSVSRSSTEAEYRALANAAAEIL